MEMRITRHTQPQAPAKPPFPNRVLAWRLPLPLTSR